MAENDYISTPTISSQRIRIPSNLHYHPPKLCIEEIVIEPEDNCESIAENNSNNE